MFDIGFWELLVIAVVLLLVLGPERLPEFAQKAAFFVRKARQGMYRLRNEMQSEMQGTPFEDLEKAKQEMASFKNDIKQFGRDLADSAEEKINLDDEINEGNLELIDGVATESPVNADAQSAGSIKKSSKKKSGKKKSSKKKTAKKAKKSTNAKKVDQANGDD